MLQLGSQTNSLHFFIKIINGKKGNIVHIKNIHPSVLIFQLGPLLLASALPYGASLEN